MSGHCSEDCSWPWLMPLLISMGKSSREFYCVGREMWDDESILPDVCRSTKARGDRSRIQGLKYFEEFEILGCQFWISMGVTKQVKCLSFGEESTKIQTGISVDAIQYHLLFQRNVKPVTVLTLDWWESVSLRLPLTHTGHPPARWQTLILENLEVPSIAISSVLGKLVNPISLLLSLSFY